MNRELGTLRLYEYPGFTQYQYSIENDYSFKKPSLTTIEKIETGNVLRVLEFESEEGVEREIVSRIKYKTVPREEFYKRMAVVDAQYGCC